LPGVQVSCIEAAAAVAAAGGETQRPRDAQRSHDQYFAIADIIGPSTSLVAIGFTRSQQERSETVDENAGPEDG